MFTTSQHAVHIKTWPGLSELDAWVAGRRHRVLSNGLNCVSTGQGRRRAVVAAYPAGHQPVGAAALPTLQETLKGDAAFVWDLVPYLCPQELALNEGMLATGASMLDAVQGLGRIARHQRAAPAWDRYDLTVVLRDRYFGAATARSNVPGLGEAVLLVLSRYGFPIQAEDRLWATDRPQILESQGDAFLTLWLPRFTHPALLGADETPAADVVPSLSARGHTLQEAFSTWYEQVRPFLNARSPLRAGLDHWVIEQTEALQALRPAEVSESEARLARAHLEVEHLQATAQLLRLVRSEIQVGHTVPGLMSAVRPLQGMLRAGFDLAAEAEEVPPGVVAAAVSAVLGLVSQHF